MGSPLYQVINFIVQPLAFPKSFKLLFLVFILTDITVVLSVHAENLDFQSKVSKTSFLGLEPNHLDLSVTVTTVARSSCSSAYLETVLPRLCLR